MPDDHKPFFAGTYFPKEPRHGLPSFTQLMRGVAQAYREQGDAIREQNQALMDALVRMNPVGSGAIPDAAAMDEALRQLADSFDAEHGGFLFAGRDHESLFHRPKPLSDESVPAGNGVAAQVLQRLGHLLGDKRYLDAATGTLRLAADQIREIPYAHTSLLIALDEHLDPAETLIIRGAGEELARWQRQAQATYAPRRLVIAIPSSEAALPGTSANMAPGPGTRAYRCSGTHCEAPIERSEDLSRCPKQGQTKYKTRKNILNSP